MNQHHKLIFDSTDPFNVPAGTRNIAYIEGSYGPAWERAIADKRPGSYYRLVESPGHDLSQIMRLCRGVGVEPGACSVQEMIVGCHERARHGHDDFTVYTSLDPGGDHNYQPGMLGVIQTLRSHAPGLPFRIHVAKWDGSPNVVQIDGVRDWAKQYEGNLHGGAYDLSALHGKDDLVRP